MDLVRRDSLFDLWPGTLATMADLNRQMSEFARQAFGDLNTGGVFVPVDVVNRDGELVVRAELPGVDPEKDLEVTVEDGQLLIRGERRHEEKEESDRFFRMERSYGSFQRSLPIPPGVKEEDIKATYNDGVLEVVVPAGKEISSGKKIPVQIGGRLKKALNTGRKKK